MSCTAKFAADGFVVAGLGKLKLSLAYRARQDFYCIVSTVECERVHGVGAGYAQAHRNSGWHQYALRDENILLGNHPHGDGSVGFLGRSQIAFDEFPLQMQSGRIDYRTAEIAPDRLVNFIVTSSGYGAAEQSDRQNKEES